MATALHAPDAPDLTRTYTADALLAFPSHWRYELVRGRLRRMPLPAGDLHGSFTFALTLSIGAYVQQNRLGRCWAAETGFLIARDPDTVLAPDFAFVAADRLLETPSAGFVPVVPDLVLETRSPSDRPRAVADKVQEWLDSGVALVLELDPQRKRLTVYRPGAEPLALGPDDTLDGGETLPGFNLPLVALFDAG